MISDNMWLGCNELVIVFKKGTYCVLESYEDYCIVFKGEYIKCAEYCKNRQRQYYEELI